MHINIGLRFSCHDGRVDSTSVSHFGDPGFQSVLESLILIVVCLACLRYFLLRGLSPHANYTDRAAAAGRRS